jgi:hypothetical protein
MNGGLEKGDACVSKTVVEAAKNELAKVSKEERRNFIDEHSLVNMEISKVGLCFFP